MAKNKYTDEQLLNIALEHKEYFHSSKVWAKHAKEFKLPGTGTYQARFGSWEKAVTRIVGGYIPNQKHYSTEELRKIALQHKDKFTTIKIWDKHAKQHSLPHSFTYKKYFGAWNEAKRTMGLEVSKCLVIRRSIDMDIKDMRSLALSFKEYFTSRSVWDEFAQTYNYPSSSKYAKCLGGGSWNQAKIHLGIKDVCRPKYSKEELVAVALKHQEYFNAQTVWDSYAKKHKLPWSSSYKRVFGSWNKAKEKIENLRYKIAG